MERSIPTRVGVNRCDGSAGRGCGNCPHWRGVESNFPLFLIPRKFGKFGKFGKFDPAPRRLEVHVNDAYILHSSQISSDLEHDERPDITPYHPSPMTYHPATLPPCHPETPVHGKIPP
jgi:hypothetical protein